VSERLPSLVVSIVTYNSAREIRNCLRSLSRAAQGFDVAVHIVDNASQDGTPEVIEDLIHELSRESLRFQLARASTNLGFTRAMNLALDGARGDAYLWLNPDVYLQEDTLATLWRVLNEDITCGIVAPQLLNPDGSIQPSCRRYPQHRDVFFEAFGLSKLLPRSRNFNAWKMGDFDHRRRAEVDQPQGACLMIHHRAASVVGPLDERFVMFFSDVDYCRRVQRAGFRILFEPAARAVHEKGASVLRNRREMIRLSHRDFERYFEKWFPNRRYRAANLVTRSLLRAILPIRLLLAR
jgi:GT2 family glycosyltransferase